MRKYISKIGLIFLMAFVIGIGYGVSAKAATDDILVGTHNLNNTFENSAKFGERLTEPEKGWKRYDDADTRIKYVGKSFSVSPLTTTSDYKGNQISTNSGPNARIRFNFKGTKLRLIGFRNIKHSPKIKVLIDNNEYEYSQQTPEGQSMNQALNFEALNLINTTHCVEIYAQVGGFLSLDAIDIDSNGELLPYSTILIAKSDSNRKAITLIWNEPDEKVENYILKKATAQGKEEKILDIKQNNYMDTDVQEGVTYYYIIVPVINGKEATPSNEASAMIEATTENPKPDTKPEQPKPDTKPEQPKPEIKGDAVLTITMTNGNIKSYNVSMKTVNKFIEWYRDRASGSNGNPFYEFDKTRNEDEIKTEYVVFDKISSFQVEQSK